MISSDEVPDPEQVAELAAGLDRIRAYNAERRAIFEADPGAGVPDAYAVRAAMVRVDERIGAVEVGGHRYTSTIPPGRMVLHGRIVKTDVITDELIEELEPDLVRGFQWNIREGAAFDAAMG